MKITTLKSVALVAMLAMGAMSASAVTFVYDGVIYKNSGNKLTAQKIGTALTTDQTAPTEYTGDIKIPNEITWDGVDYVVTSIAAVFKGSTITSIEIGDKVATIGRGGFQGCTELKAVKLPAEMEVFQSDLFSGCTSLQEISLPGKVKDVSGSAFKGCTALRKIVIEEGETGIEFSAAAFTDGGSSAIEEFEIYRALGTKYTEMDTKPFRNNKSLTKVTVGGKCKEFPASYFEGATALKTVVFANEFTTMGTSLFAGSGLEEITLPESVTTVSASCFQGCKSLKKVTLGSGVTRIDDMAFYKSTLAEINLPESLKSISQMAFSGANLSGALQIPEAVTSIGLQAFANNSGLTSVALPAGISTVADGAFMGCTGVASFAVADGNVNYAAGDQGKYLATADGKTVLAYAPAAEGTEFANNCEALAPYALYKAAKIATVSLPNCRNYGDYSLNGIAATSLEIKGEAGRFVAGDCANLTELTLECGEIPFAVAYNDAALKTVNLLRQPAVVKQDAFKGCTALEELNLGNILAILEADCFAESGIKALTVGAYYPAAMAEGVFTESSKIAVTVPATLVDSYKAAAGWKYLDIKGDANITIGGENMGMPAGLYYAGDDNMLHCAYEDGEFDHYDVGGVPHTFQLTQFKNRIYGASAGKKFVYSATGSVDGDGKLFYISKVGDEIFQAVVLDNKDNNAYMDPFGLYIYGDTLYVNDRNVCIRKISADAIALPQDYKHWMENNWMAYYGTNWTYGCIKAGFAITQSEDEKGDPEPLYWLGMKYNGNGIYRFKESNVGTNSGEGIGSKSAYPSAMIALNPIFTTFYVDEAHGHMYIYIEKAGSKEENLVKGGLYRIDLDKFDTVPDPDTFDAFEALLVDGSPVKYEGSATNEHVGISQLSPDENGEYLYWCYRAPTAAEAAANEAQDYSTTLAGKYWWADKYDETNPLHQSGIKRIKLGEANPTVEMVVPGVTGYGCVPVNYAGSKKGDGVKNIVLPAAKGMKVDRNAISLDKDATIVVYDMSGTMVASRALAAGQTMSIADLTRGGYVVVAAFAEGGQQVVKVVK